MYQNGRRLIESAEEKQVLTIKQTREKLKELVGAQQHWRSPEPVIQAELRTVESQDELPARRMCDSYREAVIPLGSDPKITEKYINFYKGIRFGRILEDLDTFAVAIGYTHAFDPRNEGQKLPVSIVTALVDRIDLCHERILPDRDVKMMGKVTWAGRTSMEITMELNQEIDNSWKKLISAKFLMVARNPVTKGSAIINKLVPEGEAEESLLHLGERNKLRRIEEGQRTLLKTPPNPEESMNIHNQFLQTIDPRAATFKVRIKPENSVWMEETILKNLIICMPEKRNLYNKYLEGF